MTRGVTGRHWRTMIRLGIAIAALAAPGMAQAALKFAVVNSSGTLVRGVGTTGAHQISGFPGAYEVDFGNNVSACGYVATAGDTGAGAVLEPVVATVAGRSGNTKGVFVQITRQDTNVGINEPFHLQLFCGTQKGAVVDEFGTLVRGGHATGAIHLGTGVYEVDFDSNVSKCAFTASAGETGNGGVAAPLEVMVAGRAGNVNGVFVNIEDRNGNFTDSPFHLELNCGSARLLAVINSNGTKKRGANVVSSQKLSSTLNDGRYEVIYNRNVSNCAYTATVGQPGNSGEITTPVTITTATRAGNSNGVFVFIHTTSGATIDEPFHLAVYCPPTAATAAADPGNGAQDTASTNLAPAAPTPDAIING